MKIFNGKKWVTLGGGGTNGDGVYRIGGFDDTKIEIYDINDELIGEISRDVAQHSILEAGEVHANNIVQFTNNSTLYIDAKNGSDTTGDGTEGNPFASITQAIESLKKYISKTLTIYIKAGTYNEDVVFSGFSGDANIHIYLANVIINGSFSIRNSALSFYIYGADSTLNHGGESEYAVVADAVTFTKIERLKVIGTSGKSQWGFHSFRGSTLIIDNCTASNFTLSSGACIAARNGGKIVQLSCKGSNNSVAIYAGQGSTASHYDTSPLATTQTKTATSGTITGSSTMTNDGSSSSNQQTVATYTKTYNATSFKSWRAVDNWRTGIWMGNFTGASNNNNYGIFGFDLATLRNDLSDKNIQSVSLTIQRKSSGGYDVNVNPRLYATTSGGTGTSAPALTKSYGELPSFTKGQKKTVTLSKTVISDILSNNSIKGLMLHQPDGKHYSIWEASATLKVTYTNTLEAYEAVTIPLE